MTQVERTGQMDQPIPDAAVQALRGSILGEVFSLPTMAMTLPAPSGTR